MTEAPKVHTLKIDEFLNIHTEDLLPLIQGDARNRLRAVLFQEKVALALECSTAGSERELWLFKGQIKEIEKLLGLLETPTEE